MTCFLLILKLFGGLIFLFSFGRTVSHLFKLDKYLIDNQPDLIKVNNNYNNEEAQNYYAINL
jgi:hypothetical protein